MPGVTADLTRSANEHCVSSLSSQLIRTIAQCERDYGLRLVGSCATGEMHLPVRRDGVIRSMSDVDLIALRNLTQHQRRHICKTIQDAGAKFGLQFSGVSIRAQSDFVGLPHSCLWRPSGLDGLLRTDRDAVLCFWTTIAVIESAITAIRNRQLPERQVKAYAVAKFFYTLARNLALLDRQILRSYRDLSHWISARIPHAPSIELLGVKTGTSRSLSPQAVEVLFGDSTLQILLGSSERMVAMCHDVARYYYGSVPLDACLYTRLASSTAPDEKCLSIAYYERSKLNEALVSGQCNGL